ncbi:unnamed protein product [Effrenium voratum]|nr:unnamed protein product [Effrenium voratum]
MMRLLACALLGVAAELDLAADQALTEELKALVGQEQHWPRGEEIPSPNDRTWQVWDTCRDPGFTEQLRKNQTRVQVRAVHVEVIEWLVRHHRDHPRRAQFVESIGHRLLQLGVVPNIYQWSELLNEELSSFPVLDHSWQSIPWPGVLSALRWLEGNFTDRLLPAFELAKQKQLFNEHPEGLHLTGYWETAYVWQGGCKVDVYPKVCELLKAIYRAWPTKRGIQEARFARMHPKTLVVDHTADTNQRIKIHCGIENPSNVTMHIANVSVTWQPGRCVLVDVA